MAESELLVLARQRAYDLLSGLGQRWMHARSVGKRAQELPLELAMRDEVVAAAWLHDVGYAVVDTGFHPLDGAVWAEAEGFPDLVVSLIAYHTGAKVEADERGLSGELAKFGYPPQEPLDILTFIDMTTSPNGLVVSPSERVSEILNRYERADGVHRAVTRSGASLIESADRGRALISA